MAHVAKAVKGAVTDKTHHGLRTRSPYSTITALVVINSGTLCLHFQHDNLATPNVYYGDKYIDKNETKSVLTI